MFVEPNGQTITWLCFLLHRESILVRSRLDRMNVEKREVGTLEIFMDAGLHGVAAYLIEHKIYRGVLHYAKDPQGPGVGLGS